MEFVGADTAVLRKTVAQLPPLHMRLVSKGEPKVRLWIVLAVVSIGLLISAPAFAIGLTAQSGTATLSGTVTDESGAVVNDVAITLTSESTGHQRKTKSGAEGFFILPFLPPGKYVIKAVRDGFRPEIASLVLNVNDHKTVEITLQAGSLSETITVTDKSYTAFTGAVETLIDNRFVENVPLNGRSFQALIALAPGVVLTRADASNPGQFSVNGQRANANYFTIDGVSANIGISPNAVTGPSSGSLPGFNAFGGTNNLVSIDAMQEFKVQASTYAPEFGRTQGGQISIITSSGTNEFHGALFDYFRNDVLDANDWFANSRGQKRPALRQNDFGVALGGPILLPWFGRDVYDGKNRTFFFVSYEGLRLRQPLFGITDVPSVNTRRARVASPAIGHILNAFPIPNGPEDGDGYAEFAASFSNPSSLNATSVRIDAIKGGLSLFGRYNHAPSDSEERGLELASLNTVTRTAVNTETLTAGATFAAGPNVSNDVRVNYSRNEGSNFNRLDNLGGAIVPPESALFPSFATSADSRVLLTIMSGGRLLVGRVADNLQRQMNIVDGLSVIAGLHQLKIGVDYRRLSPVIGPQEYSLQVDFESLQSLLSGEITTASVTASRDKLFPVLTNFSFYGQDSWRRSPRLSLTYGLRLELNLPPSEARGNDPFALVEVNDSSKLNLGPRGAPAYRTSWDVAPRLGLAYRLSQRSGQESVLRGGFGVFYDLGSNQALSAFFGFPYGAEKTVTAPATFPLDPTSAAPPALPDVLNPGFPIPFIAGSDPDLKSPYSYQWNVALQQSLGSSQMLSASYVAAIGRRLLRQEEIFNPNTRFNRVFLTKNAAESNYQALQVQFQRRMSRGIQALLSYTWSHSIDNASADGILLTPAERLDPRLDRGAADFDVRHLVSAALTYDIPRTSDIPVIRSVFRGFALDVIFAARSPTPIDVLVFRDIGFGFLPFRPDLIGGVPIWVDDPFAPGGRRINTSMIQDRPNQVGPFNVPGDARQGNLGRNSLRGFSFHQVDLALRRKLALTERLSLQLKVEAFNVFNHPNFADPNFGDISNALGFVFDGSFFFLDGFGRSPSMFGRSLGRGGTHGGFNPLYQVGGPRSIQASAKILF